MKKYKQIVRVEIFSKQELEDYAISRSIKRGINLYQSGAVINPKITGTDLDAYVQGTRKYKTSIRWDATENDWGFRCSCPYDMGGICKHSIALGLWMIDNCKYKPATEPEDYTSEIDVLLNQADTKVLNDFVRNAISADNILFAKFKTLVNNLEAAIEDTSIDKMVKHYTELFTSMEIPDEEEANENIDWQRNDYYREEWELIEEAQQQAVEEHLEGAYAEIIKLIETGRLLQAIYYYFAITEAYNDYKETNIEDIYDELEVIEEYIDEQQNEIILLIGKLQFHSDTIDIIIETFIKRYLSGEFSDYYVSIYEKLLLSLPYTKVQANTMMELIKNISISTTDELLLKFGKIIGNNDLTLKIYWDIVGVNRDAVMFLLEKYKDDPIKYHYIVEKAIPKFQNDILPEIFPNLNKEINPELYRNAADKCFQLTGDISYYCIYKDSINDFKFNHYINQLSHIDNANTFNILIHEKQYESAFDFYLKNLSNRYHHHEFLLKLIYDLPQTCFDHIIKETSKNLATPKKREEYSKAGRLLTVLKSFKDNELCKKGHQYIADLCRKYKNRPAMLDEFRSLKLI